MSQSSYNSDSARYEAYQFSDPFATSTFVCCNKKLSKVCRPNCDHYPKVTSKEDVSFLFDANQAVSAGFEACEHCDPCNPSSQLDLPLIKITIESINYSIGFTDDANDLKRRAFSVPSINTNNGHYDRQLTRNESEHIKLVELACRHIAAAAALSISKQGEEAAQGGKKKRRGGVLGFKELASKSKLSPWHFHRVFKSVTGLTPKSYGDQCWKFIKDHDRPPTKRQRSHFKSLSEVSSNFQAPKRSGKVEDDVAPTAPSYQNNLGPMSEIPVRTMPQQQQVQPSQPPQQAQLQQQLQQGINTQLSLGTDLFDLNKNSLDINMAPLRHHSLDLGTLSLDLGDFNKIDNSISNLVPMANNNNNNINANPLQLQQPHPQQAPRQFTQQAQLQVPPPAQIQQQQQQLVQQDDPSRTVSESVSSTTDLSTLSLNVLEDPQWPALESAGSVDQEISKLLTPPSSVGDADINTKADATMEFYDVLNKSPLETDDFLSLNGGAGDYALLNDGAGGDDEIGAGLFLGTDGNEIFNEVTNFKNQGNNLMI